MNDFFLDLPGFEPGFSDSESKVITITLQVQNNYTNL